MKHEIAKISKIVDELIDFYFLNSAKKVNISIEENKDSFIIEIESDDVSCSEDKIMNFKKLINVQRQKEIEEYYWQLAGTSIEGEEYNLVGMMIDESIIDYDYPKLKIKLIRKK
ncbi:MAG: hypothetical protein PHE29_09075 [Tissierellia bacterium]|nr:hypothetical protein [Tissierellia bacterium]MDD4781359.1 hypothetical protein [Tissierellia bacterium]